MPRVTPRKTTSAGKITGLHDTLADELEYKQRHKEAAHEFKQRSGELLSDVEAKHGLRISARDRSVYGDPSGPSWFVDRMLMAAHHAQRHAMIEAGIPEHGTLQHVLAGLAPSPDLEFDVESVERRLMTVESRSGTTSATAGGGFVPSGSVPSYVSDAFGLGVHNYAVLARALETRPLPPTGMTITAPRIGTMPATTAVQASENSSISDSTPNTATSGDGLAMIAGKGRRLHSVARTIRSAS